MRIFYLLFLYKVVLVGMHKKVHAVPVGRALALTDEHIDDEIPDDYIKKELANLDYILNRKSEQRTNNIEGDISNKKREKDFNKKDYQIKEDNCEGNCNGEDYLYKSIEESGNNSEYGERSGSRVASKNRTNTTYFETRSRKEMKYSNEDSDGSRNEDFYKNTKRARNKSERGQENDPDNESRNEINEDNIMVRNYKKNEYSNVESDESSNGKFHGLDDETTSDENGVDYLQKNNLDSGSKKKDRIIETGLKLRNLNERKDKDDEESDEDVKHIAEKIKEHIAVEVNKLNKISSSSNGGKGSYLTSNNGGKNESLKYIKEMSDSSPNSNSRSEETDKPLRDNNNGRDSLSDENESGEADSLSNSNDEGSYSSDSEESSGSSDSEESSDSSDSEKSSDSSDASEDSSDYSSSKIKKLNEKVSESLLKRGSSTQEERDSVSKSGDYSEANSNEANKSSTKSGEESGSSSGSENKSEEADKLSKSSEEGSTVSSNSNGANELSTDGVVGSGLSTKCEEKSSSSSDLQHEVDSPDNCGGSLSNNKTYKSSKGRIKEMKRMADSEVADESSSDDEEESNSSSDSEEDDQSSSDEGEASSSVSEETDYSSSDEGEEGSGLSSYSEEAEVKSGKDSLSYKMGGVNSLNPLEKLQNKTKYTIPKGLGNYFAYFDCKNCKINSELEVKGKIPDKDNPGDNKNNIFETK